MSRRLRWRIARPILVRLAQADLLVDRAQSALHHVLESALPAVLSAHELAELSGRLYERRTADAARPVFAWERAWLELLPPAPAYGLVGGAGHGPECELLAEGGYRVDAYDPSARGVEACQRRIGARGVAFQAIHEDLLEPGGAPLRERYDFVWLGWGSLSHVLEPSARAGLLEACARLTDGPILGSCRTADQLSPMPRVRRLTDAVLTRAGLAPGARGLQFQPQVGLATTLLTDELHAVADRLGRRLELTQAFGVTAFALLRE